MKPWRERNAELSALFNPAFCGLLIYTSITFYQKQNELGMPLPLSFLLLPIILSSQVRETLPRTSRTPFHLWLQREPQIKIRLAARVANLSSITREALLFLIQRQRLSLVKDRCMKGKVIRGVASLSAETPELGDLLEAARISGTMFGRMDDAETIFTSLGITL